MSENKTKNKDFEVFCCFANNENNIEKTIGFAFMDYVQEKIKSKNKKEL